MRSVSTRRVLPVLVLLFTFAPVVESSDIGASAPYSSFTQAAEARDVFATHCA